MAFTAAVIYTTRSGSTNRGAQARGPVLGQRLETRAHVDADTPTLGHVVAGRGGPADNGGGAPREVLCCTTERVGGLQRPRARATDACMYFVVVGSGVPYLHRIIYNGVQVVLVVATHVPAGEIYHLRKRPAGLNGDPHRQHRETRLREDPMPNLFTVTRLTCPYSAGPVRPFVRF